LVDNNDVILISDMNFDNQITKGSTIVECTTKAAIPISVKSTERKGGWNIKNRSPYNTIDLVSYSVYQISANCLQSVTN